jgi:lipoprotein-anchoring transpeptidase ErfK/SrfK
MNTREYLIDDQESKTPELPKEPSKPRRSVLRIILYSFLSLLGFTGFVAFCLYFLFYIIPSGPELALSRGLAKDKSMHLEKQPVDSVKILKEIAALEKKIDKLTTQGPYLIINTTENRFYLYDGSALIREGRCSTGKNTRLIDEKRKKEYEFKTPRGVHKVLRKQKNPVWAKPNWAFIEEGLPIPPAGHESRFDRYTLGDYKLEIGDGYMVHGTLYKRRMGLPVTHGCVRLLDEDLEIVYNTMPVGSKVIIY